MTFDSLYIARAVYGAEGLLNLLGGGITRLNAEVLPWREPSLSVVARFFLDRSDLSREHDVDVRVTMPSGKELAYLSFPLTPEALEPLAADTVPGELLAVHLIGDMRGLRFNEEGVHSFVVFVNNEEQYRYPLPVVLRHPA